MKYFIPIFVAVALSTALFLILLSDATAIHKDGNLGSALSFTLYSHHPIFSDALNNQYERDFSMWQGRWAALWCSAKYWDFCFPWLISNQPALFDSYQVPRYCVVWSAYFTFWYFAYCAIVIWFRKFDWPIFMTFGFAAIVTNACAITTMEVFLPWDVLSMCFFALGLFLFESGKINLIWLVALVGSFFKETTLVLVLLPLLTKGDFKFPAMFVTAIAFTVSRQLSCHMKIGDVVESGEPRWKTNWHFLTHSIANNFIFVDCGLILLVFLFPMNWRIKVMCAAFVAGMTFMGGYNEYRQFFDILPAGILGLSNYITKQNYEKTTR